jgi:hypothetical protein
MLGLLLTQSPPRSASAGDDDYDVVGPDGWVIGWIARRGPSSCEESAHQCRARLHAYGSASPKSPGRQRLRSVLVNALTWRVCRLNHLREAIASAV